METHLSIDTLGTHACSNVCTHKHTHTIYKQSHTHTHTDHTHTYTTHSHHTQTTHRPHHTTHRLHTDHTTPHHNYTHKATHVEHPHPITCTKIYSLMSSMVCVMKGPNLESMPSPRALQSGMVHLL